MNYPAPQSLVAGRKYFESRSHGGEGEGAVEGDDDAFDDEVGKGGGAS